jgi:hypothetical protein
MNILLWRELLAGDIRLVGISEDGKNGATSVYGACASPWAAWRLLRHMQQLGYPCRRDRWSVWLGPAEWHPTPPGRMVMDGVARHWWQRLVPHRATFWQRH